MVTSVRRLATLDHGRWPLMIGAMLSLAAAGAALAAPPTGSDPNSELAKWFRSLRNNGSRSCCDIADCRYVESCNTDSGLQAFIDGQWVDIPLTSVLSVANPTNRAVACYRYIEANGDDFVVFCFIPIADS